MIVKLEVDAASISYPDGKTYIISAKEPTAMSVVKRRDDGLTIVSVDSLRGVYTKSKARTLQKAFREAHDLVLGIGCKEIELHNVTLVNMTVSCADTEKRFVITDLMWQIKVEESTTNTQPTPVEETKND